MPHFSGPGGGSGSVLFGDITSAGPGGRGNDTVNQMVFDIIVKKVVFGGVGRVIGGPGKAVVEAILGTLPGGAFFGSLGEGEEGHIVDFFVNNGATAAERERLRQFLLQRMDRTDP